MSSRQDEILLNTFLEAAGGEWRGVAADDLLALLAAALEERAQTAAATATPSGSTSSGGQQDEGSGASKVLTSALGMVPVAKALISLFGGGDTKTPAPLVRFALPPSLRFEAANSSSGVASLDYGQEGLPRVATRSASPAKSGLPEETTPAGGETYGGSAFEKPIEEVARQFGEYRQAAKAPGSETAYGERVAAGTPREAAIAQRVEAGVPREAAHVTIQVQAMDSRSFLDHSAEIAQAVREAMLNMHSLNDVVSDI